MRKLLVLSVIVLCLAAPAAAKTPPFQPAQLTGKWNGSWHNVTFDSTGRAFIRAKASGRGTKAKLTFLSDFGGLIQLRKS